MPRSVMAAPWGTAEGADVLCVVVDAARAQSSYTRSFLDKLTSAELSIPKVLILNKVATSGYFRGSTDGWSGGFGTASGSLDRRLIGTACFE